MLHEGEGEKNVWVLNSMKTLGKPEVTFFSRVEVERFCNQIRL